jgi:formylglycine-generating enzyme
MRRLVPATLAAAALLGCRLHFEPLQSDARSDASGDASVGQVSCVGLAETCGPGGDQSCCASSVVPGGTFYRGYDVAFDAAFADMSNPATVGAFRLDTYEVTVGRFRAFVDAGRGVQSAPPAAGDGTNPRVANSGWVSGWNTLLPVDRAELTSDSLCNTFATWTDAPGANESLPMNCVNWYVAAAFCAWDGGFLPTQAEWNFAASGGDEQRAYAWSAPAGDTTIDCTRANYDVCGAGTDRAGSLTSGNGRWGHADLGGNVWEWVLDVSVPYPNPCDDCAALEGSSSRVVRGGSFVSIISNVRSAFRYEYFATSHTDNVGIRCARAL